MLTKNLPSLLVVDDDEQNLNLIKALLSKLEIGVDLVSSGEQAIQKIENKKYFLILMDVKMPKLDGFETVSLIKRNDNYKDTPIIFLTGYENEGYEIKGYDEGAVDFIMKPFNSHILISKIKVFLTLYTQQIIIKEYSSALDPEVKERINELMLAKDAAIQANFSKSNFLTSISHELRTPMHGILSYAKMGMKKLTKETDEKLFRYFRNIDNSAERLLLLLNDLLDLSKLEAGKMNVSFKKKSLLEIVVDCIVEQQARLDELDISVVCNPECSATLVEVDVGRISQVVTNLLSNAIKFTDKGQTIDINISEIPIDDIDISSEHKKNINNKDIAAVLFSIRDHGKGILEGEEKIIFDNFVQGSDDVVEKVKGTGLGLPICKEIIGLHHGNIWSKNHVDGGAVFNFKIPLAHIDDEFPKRRAGDQ